VQGLNRAAIDVPGEGQRRVDCSAATDYVLTLGMSQEIER